MKVAFNGKAVEVVVPSHFPDNFEQLLAQYYPFYSYVARFSPAVSVSKIEFYSLDLFGARIGFLKFKLTADACGKRLPGVVFMRGGSVAILVVVNDKYVLLTHYYRVPIGQYFAEVPAGMIDDNERFSGAAARELEEECGIKLAVSDLKDLGDMIPSAGGCDEFIHLYQANVWLNDEAIARLLSSTFGEGEHEAIKCSLIPLDDAYELTDAKLLCCLARYQKRQY